MFVRLLSKTHIDWTLFNHDNATFYDIVTQEAKGTQQRWLQNEAVVMRDEVKTIIDSHLYMIQRALWCAFNGVAYDHTKNIDGAYTGGIGSNLAAIICDYIHMLRDVIIRARPSFSF